MEHKIWQSRVIVTHPGSAHRDELISLALVFAHLEKTIAVSRREPFPEEIASADVLVVDVGRVYDVNTNCYDHHQFGRESTPKCAFSLIAEALGYDQVLKLRKWYEPCVMMDVLGPYQTATRLGLPRFPFELAGPLEGQLLSYFEDQVFLPEGHWFSEMLLVLGKGMVEDAQEYSAKLDTLSAMVQEWRYAGKTILVFPTKDVEGSQEVRDSRFPDAAVSISWDDRGAGWSLYRFNDSPNIDFARISNDARVSFAHAGGFIAKTHKLLNLTEVFELVAMAMTE